MKKRDTFEELIETVERNAVDNKVTITNVKLWAKSWRNERKLDEERNEFDNLLGSALKKYDDGFDASEIANGLAMSSAGVQKREF
jgi:hypothetical protein